MRSGHTSDDTQQGWAMVQRFGGNGHAARSRRSFSTRSTSSRPRQAIGREQRAEEDTEVVGGRRGCARFLGRFLTAVRWPWKQCWTIAQAFSTSALRPSGHHAQTLAQALRISSHWCQLSVPRKRTPSTASALEARSAEEPVLRRPGRRGSDVVVSRGRARRDCRDEEEHEPGYVAPRRH